MIVIECGFTELYKRYVPPKSDDDLDYGQEMRRRASSKTLHISKKLRAVSHLSTS